MARFCRDGKPEALGVGAGMEAVLPDEGNRQDELAESTLRALV